MTVTEEGLEGQLLVKAQVLLLLLLLTPNKILKKTENRVLLSVSEWGPSTAGKDQKKEKIFKKMEKFVQCYKKTREHG